MSTSAAAGEGGLAISLHEDNIRQMAIFLRVVDAIAGHKHIADREADEIDRDPDLARDYRDDADDPRLRCKPAWIEAIRNELKCWHPRHPRPTDAARLPRPEGDVGYRLRD
jgi:hypothetical protein